MEARSFEFQGEYGEGVYKKPYLHVGEVQMVPMVPLPITFNWSRPAFIHKCEEDGRISYGPIYLNGDEAYEAEAEGNSCTPVKIEVIESYVWEKVIVTMKQLLKLPEDEGGGYGWFENYDLPDGVPIYDPGVHGKLNRNALYETDVKILEAFGYHFTEEPMV